jgi:hypothetical protein
VVFRFRIQWAGWVLVRFGAFVTNVDEEQSNVDEEGIVVMMG